MFELKLHPKWKDRLVKAELTTVESLLQLTLQEPLEFIPGSVGGYQQINENLRVFLHYDGQVDWSRVLRYFVMFEWPYSLTEHERRGIEMLRKAGFQVAEIIAWGEKKTLGLPRQGLLLLLAMSGLPLPQFLQQELNEKVRRKAIQTAEEALQALQEKGFLWQDCLPKNFFVQADGSVALVNLYSVRQRKLTAIQAQQQFELFYSRL